MPSSAWKKNVCRSEEHTSELQSLTNLVCRLLLEKKTNSGLGVFYWEPQCSSWQGYQLWAWNPVAKQPTVSLDAFLGIYVTSVSFFLNVTAPPELYPFSPHAFLPI